MAFSESGLSGLSEGLYLPTIEKKPLILHEIDSLLQHQFPRICDIIQKKGPDEIAKLIKSKSDATKKDLLAAIHTTAQFVRNKTNVVFEKSDTALNYIGKILEVDSDSADRFLEYFGIKINKLTPIAAQKLGLTYEDLLTQHAILAKKLLTLTSQDDDSVDNKLRGRGDIESRETKRVIWRTKRLTKKINVPAPVLVDAGVVVKPVVDKTGAQKNKRMVVGLTMGGGCALLALCCVVSVGGLVLASNTTQGREFAAKYAFPTSTPEIRVKPTMTTQEYVAKEYSDYNKTNGTPIDWIADINTSTVQIMAAEKGPAWAFVDSRRLDGFLDSLVGGRENLTDAEYTEIKADPNKILDLINKLRNQKSVSPERKKQLDAAYEFYNLLITDRDAFLKKYNLGTIRQNPKPTEAPRPTPKPTRIPETGAGFSGFTKNAAQITGYQPVSAKNGEIQMQPVYGAYTPAQRRKIAISRGRAAWKQVRG
jgi:hypothetical protein